SEITRESLLVYWGLLKIIVPVMVIVEIAMRFGIVEIISRWCEPVMNLVGLPAETAVILATNLLVGLYGAAAALITLAPNLDLTVADMTVLGGILLFVHALPMEQIIVKKTGVSLTFSLFTRLLAAIIYGWLLHVIFTTFDLFDDPANILISIETASSDTSWIGWIKTSVLGLFGIFWILFFMITLLKILDLTGITGKITKLLTPGLKLLGIGPNAAPLAMIGILLGLAFGGALILREIKKGHLQPRSIFLSIIFMGFCHSLIEDTLIIMAFGGHWSGVLIARVLISLLLMAPVSFMVLKMSDHTFNRYLYKSSKKPALPDE
ncbi:MAG: hypothetical protein JKX94_02305, partial [Sneathiella sp.]|nr:hypothetical protein [Sneathiella sp.]